MAEPNSDTIRAHWKCFLACGIILLCPFQYGLDFGIIGGFQAMPGFLQVRVLQFFQLLPGRVGACDTLLTPTPLRTQVYGQRAPNTVIGWNIPIVRQQLISSLVTLGAFLSSGAAGLLAIKLGRKTCLWMGCLLCIVANVIMMTTTHIGALYVGRLLLGVANGALMTFSQLYIQETSPAKYRGLFFTCFSFSTSFVRQTPET
jgi:MFS family permease